MKAESVSSLRCLGEKVFDQAAIVFFFDAGKLLNVIGTLLHCWFGRNDLSSYSDCCKKLSSSVVGVNKKLRRLSSVGAIRFNNSHIVSVSRF